MISCNQLFGGAVYDGGVASCRWRARHAAVIFGCILLFCRDSLAHAKCAQPRQVRDYVVVDIHYQDGVQDVPSEVIPGWAKESHIRFVARTDGIALRGEETYMILLPE